MENSLVGELSGCLSEKPSGGPQLPHCRLGNTHSLFVNHARQMSSFYSYIAVSSTLWLVLICKMFYSPTTLINYRLIIWVKIQPQESTTNIQVRNTAVWWWHIKSSHISWIQPLVFFCFFCFFKAEMRSMRKNSVWGLSAESHLYSRLKNLSFPLSDTYLKTNCQRRL